MTIARQLPAAAAAFAGVAVLASAADRGWLAEAESTAGIRPVLGEPFVVLIQPAAKLVVEVFPEAGRERFLDRELVGPAPVRLPLRPEEQGRAGVIPEEPLGELEPVGHVEHPDLRVQQSAGDLVTDL